MTKNNNIINNNNDMGRGGAGGRPTPHPAVPERPRLLLFLEVRVELEAKA